MQQLVTEEAKKFWKEIYEGAIRASHGVMYTDRRKAIEAAIAEADLVTAAWLKRCEPSAPGQYDITSARLTKWGQEFQAIADANLQRYTPTPSGIIRFLVTKASGQAIGLELIHESEIAKVFKMARPRYFRRTEEWKAYAIEFREPRFVAHLGTSHKYFYLTHDSYKLIALARKAACYDVTVKQQSI